MKLQAFLLITFLGLAGASAGLAQDDAAPAAPSNEESAAVDSGNAGSAAAEPAAESAAESAAAPAAKDAAPAAPATIRVVDDLDVDAVIAAFNEGRDALRKFTDEERSWIGAGVAPEDIDNAHQGYVAIPSTDPNVVIINRNGKELRVTSNAGAGRVPVITPDSVHMMPFAPEVDNGTFWMSKAASETAKDVDRMFNFIMWINYIFAAIIGGLMVVFCVKYRRRPGVRADQSITHNTPLEITWSIIPTILCAIMFWGGYVTFLDLRTPPPDSMKVNVTAYRWGWNFQYPNGVESPQEFHVPANTPIEMVMTSTDTLHSFHLPAYRSKSDVLPNRYTKIWFNSGEPGTYRVYCTEYCGKDHSNMYAKLVVEPREDYEAWLTKAGNWMVNENGEMKPLLEIGELTYNRRGCKSCHSIDGKKGTGPTFAGLWGRERKFDDKTSAVADEQYINQSIRDPYSQVVVDANGVSYGKQMTIYSPMLPVEQINGMIEFIKSLEGVARQD